MRKRENVKWAIKVIGDAMQIDIETSTEWISTTVTPKKKKRAVVKRGRRG